MHTSSCWPARVVWWTMMMAVPSASHVLSVQLQNRPMRAKLLHPQACGRTARGTGSSNERDGSYGHWALEWSAAPMALFRMPVQCCQHQLWEIWCSLVELAITAYMERSQVWILVAHL